MNKQALVFLTLFSLILMLSIYYVTTPINPAKDSVVSDIAEGSIASLQVKLDEKRSELRKENAIILASTSASEQEKQLALEVMAQLDAIIQKEELVQQALSALGYDQTFVEIEGQQMRIVVETEKETVEDAARIISAALQETDQQYVVEVSFRLKSQ